MFIVVVLVCDSGQSGVGTCILGDELVKCATTIFLISIEHYPWCLKCYFVRRTNTRLAILIHLPNQ